MPGPYAFTISCSDHSNPNTFSLTLNPDTSISGFPSNVNYARWGLNDLDFTMTLSINDPSGMPSGKTITYNGKYDKETGNVFGQMGSNCTALLKKINSQ